MEEGFPRAIESLLAIGRRPDENGRVEGKTGTVREEDQDEGEDEEFYVLHIAAFEGQFECVKLLVELAEVKIDALDDMDSTPLLNAAVNGHSEIMRWLLEKGANPNHKREKGLNVIECAAKSGNLASLQLILDHPTFTDLGQEAYTNLVPFAAHSANPDVLRVIFSKAGFPSPPRPQGLTKTQLDVVEAELCRAITASSIDSTRLMLSYLTPSNADGTFHPFAFTSPANHANVFNSTEDSITNTPLFTLVWETLFLPFASVNTEATPNHPSYNQELNRRLMSAAGAGALDTLTVLLDRFDADVNHISHKYRATPLYNATGQHSTDVAKVLLDHGADIHLGSGTYANGPTALHMAVRNGNRAVAILLLQRGGPVEAVVNSTDNLQPLKEGTDMVIVAVDAFRAPVYVRTKAEHEKVKEEYEGPFHVAKFIVGEDVTVEEILAVQIRRRDVRLGEEGQKTGGRPLMTVEDVKGGDEAEEWLTKMGLAAR